MPNCGKVRGKYCGKAMENARKSLLKSRVLFKGGKKVAKKGGIYALDLHKLMKECEKEMMDFKIRITESTVST